MKLNFIYSEVVLDDSSPSLASSIIFDKRISHNANLFFLIVSSLWRSCISFSSSCLSISSSGTTFLFFSGLLVSSTITILDEEIEVVMYLVMSSCQFCLLWMWRHLTFVSCLERPCLSEILSWRSLRCSNTNRNALLFRVESLQIRSKFGREKLVVTFSLLF